MGTGKYRLEAFNMAMMMWPSGDDRAMQLNIGRI
jgi:hypothetical protein